ncbi:UCH-domain-containing protein [Choiromyces venosus 120613-1]|uniref:ubiquitinyl hydrolase 1 n=1 Tax=Choiromyces venosus 120613-1 TaxID=1336337 RepID=A0A3N4JV40_9PEZI|nr:UCH-domain-containing protein [Choiromyces venosus 120613-1]
MPLAEEKSRRESSVDMADGSVASSEGNGGVTRIDATPAATSTAPSTATTTAVGSIQPSSASATSVSSVSIPSIEDQVDFILKTRLEARIKEGDLGYIISGPWLYQFMAKAPDSGIPLSKEDAEREMGPIDNSDLVDTTQIQGQAKKTSDDSTCSRENDDDSAVPKDFVPIKPGNLGEDFEILTEEAWNSLVSWYGLAEGSPVITRRAVDTSGEFFVSNIQYELYPPTFTLHRLRDPSVNITKDLLDKEKLQSPKKIIAGKTDSFQKFLKKVKRLVGVEATRKSRLWRIIEKPSELDLELTSKSSKKAGLGAGGTIVIEEQSSDGEWISEKSTKSIKKAGQQVTVALNGKNVSGGMGKKISTRPDSPSGSTGAAVIKSFLNRPGERRPLGKCGLSNLGNTCYMNSALQCLRSVVELSKYFLRNEYMEELNPSNPLSHGGEVAKAYANLLGHIFSSSCPASVSPRVFKATISRFSVSFSGYGQQDTQEFLAFLLDGLHEDLNRIQKKPYIEKPESTDEMVGDNEAIAKLAQEHWSIYKQRNDSVIADLFGGLYQSTLVCPDCEKVSITFDPFIDLTLPLPVENVWGRDIYYFPSSASGKRLVKIPVEMDKNSSIKSLKEHFAKKFNLDSKKIMASEVYKGKFFKHYEDYQTVSEAIRQDDDAFIYELDDVPTNYPPPKGKKSRRTGFYGPNYIFGLPFFIVLNRDEVRSLDAIMKKMIEKYQVLTTRDFYESETSPSESETEEVVEVKDELDDINEAEEETDDGFVDVSMKDASSMVGSDRKTVKRGSRRPLPAGIQDLFTVKVTKRRSGDSAVITGWQSLEHAFDIRERLNREQSASPPPRKTSSYFTNTGLSGGASPRKRKGIHLKDCLDEFAKEEILSEEDPWFCPRCKVHRRASKKFELWKCPDILVIHLKRFSSSRNFRDKIDVLIDCPVTGLNLQERVGLREEGKGLVYDLIAVDNHYGGLGGGHYTAFAKSWIDDKWYYYDDSSVREVSEQKVITPAAYLLFYRRRSEDPLGGPNLRMLSESVNSPGSASSSRNTSPTRAGEDGPSDDFSATVFMNGRSSGGGASTLPTLYSDTPGNTILWGDEPPPPYAETTGKEMVLVSKPQGSPTSGKVPNVGFGFSSRRDSSNDGVFIGPLLDASQDGEMPTDITVGDDEGILPSSSDGNDDTTELHSEVTDTMES